MKPRLTGSSESAPRGKCLAQVESDHTLNGPALLVIAASEAALEVPGVDVLPRTVDRAPPFVRGRTPRQRSSARPRFCVLVRRNEGTQMFDSTRSTSSRTVSTTWSPPMVAARSLRSELVQAAAMRQAQLVNLRPIDAGDHVATEYRASVRRIYDEILAALDRIDAGSYGVCTDCTRQMPAQRLVDRPWVPKCEPCTARLL